MDCAPNQICDRSNYVSLLQDLCLVQLNTLFLRLLKWSGWCFFSGGLGVMDLSWCYRFFRNKFFLSLLSREVEDETVSSRLCDWFGGEGAEVRPGEEVPEWWCRLLKIVKLLTSISKIYILYILLKVVPTWLVWFCGNRQGTLKIPLELLVEDVFCKYWDCRSKDWYIFAWQSDSNMCYLMDLSISQTLND